MKNKLLKNYIPYLYFFVFEVLLVLFISIANFLGLSSDVGMIILYAINLLIYTFFGYRNGKRTNLKGLIEGLKTAFILSFIFILLGLIFFIKDFSFATILYYISLYIVCAISSLIGKNKKEDTTEQ